MRKLLILGLAVLLVIGVAGAVAVASAASDQNKTAPDTTPPATPPPGHWTMPDRKAGPPMMGMVLGLTQDQLDAIQSIQQEQVQAVQDLQAELRGLQTQYQEALDSNDTDKIAQIREDFAALQQETAQLRDQTQAKLLDVLTPEQQELYNQYKDQAPSGQWGMFGGFGGLRGFGMRCRPGEHGQFDHPQGNETPDGRQTY